jgi:5-methylcytosine-specific restriction endonuclease McrA
LKEANAAFDVGPRGGKRWFCSLCGETTEEVEIDHYPEPVIALDRKWFTYSIDEFYRNVFFLDCRVLCKKCHKSETKIQNQNRKKETK